MYTNILSLKSYNNLIKVCVVIHNSPHFFLFNEFKIKNSFYKLNQIGIFEKCAKSSKKNSLESLID